VRLSRAENALFLQAAEQLLGVERVALGGALQIGDEPRFRLHRQRVSARDQRPQRGVVQASQVEPFGGGLPDQGRQQVGEGVAPGQFVGSVGGDQQQREGGQVPGEEAE
jgi:hypothetical protein